MKNLNKKIIMSVLTLVLTVIALGTTTFAWFSLSTVSQVSNITGEVIVGDGLEIRLVSGNENTPWKANLSSTDVSTFIDNIFGGKKLDAVTPKDGTFEEFTKMKFHNKQQQLGHTAAKNVDYIEFEVQFRSQQEGVVELTDLTFNLLADANEKVFIVEGEAYTQVTGKGETAYPVHTQAAYGARVSFGNQAVFQHGGTEIAVVGEGEEAIVKGNTIMGEDPVTAGQWSYLKDSQSLLVYDNEGEPVTTAIAANALTEDDIVIGGENATVKVALSGANNQYTGNITVRIWIEGWDADTYDAMFGTTLDISMEFAKQEVVVGP